MEDVANRFIQLTQINLAIKKKNASNPAASNCRNCWLFKLFFLNF